MFFVVLLFLALFVVIALTTQEVMQTLLAGCWVFMLLTGVVSIASILLR